MVTRVAFLLVAVGLTLSAAARADDAVPREAATAASSRGDVRHAPISVARPGSAILVHASVEHPDLVRRALLVYRAADGHLGEAPFERAPNGPYVAVIPKEHVVPPYVDYAIELEDESGARREVFASRSAMHRIEVTEERMDVAEEALLSRIGGRRSVIAVEGDYVSFGESQATVGSSGRSEVVADRYYRGEARYTYRLLRTVSEFGIRIGLVRGQSPVPNAANAGAFDVGLNYGAPTAQFALSALFHLDAELLASLTEQGFSGGGGGALHIGDVFGSELVLGFESIDVFGNRVYTRLDVAAAPRVILSATVEGTDMPHASRFGLRLLGEIGVDLGAGFRIAGRGGYQARDSASGGPSIGLVGSYAF